jgi:hypothetical protein
VNRALSVFQLLQEKSRASSEMDSWKNLTGVLVCYAAEVWEGNCGAKRGGTLTL